MAVVLASLGRRPFLPGPLSPPLSYVPQPCNGLNGPKGFPSNKDKNKTKRNGLGMARSGKLDKPEVSTTEISGLEYPENNFFDSVANYCGLLELL